ncbi:MAG: hypothetical protein JO304_07200 [Solirubrobacterales bacterium]|nr:hypothetical protein [Solirubrobacterales bacterium]
MSIVQKQSAVERLRRSIDRLARDGDAVWAEGSTDDCAELRLEVLLLREENARLKADRHRPVDLGVIIEYLRLIGSQRARPETDEDAWGALSDCHVIREALAQASIEIELAISALEAQLREDGPPLADVVPLGVAVVDEHRSASVSANAEEWVRTA